MPWGNLETLEARLWSRVDKSGDCWIWMGGTNTQGYGRIQVLDKKKYTHRVSYELTIGPIPAGLVIDHTCHNHSCVNPRHLRPTTVKQNCENRDTSNRRNSSGVRGVSWRPRNHKWLASVGHNGKCLHLGLFDTVAEAEAVVVAKRNELFTHNDADRVTTVRK